MMTRILLAAAIMFPQIAAAKEWNFDVYLDKTRIGEHTFKLNDASELISQAKFNVKVLFINAYKYNHYAAEVWQDHCLRSLESNTLENDVATRVNGKFANGEFIVNDGKEKQVLPECPMTFAYWNQKMLQQTKLLNPQNGEWLDTKIRKIGNELLDVKDRKIETIRYKLDASMQGKRKLNIDLWYDAESHDWVGLKSITPEGYTIHYKLK